MTGCEAWLPAVVMRSSGEPMAQADEEALMRHLAGCAACREAGELLASGEALLSSTRESPHPLSEAAFIGRVGQALDASRPRATRRSWRHLLPRLFVPAAAAAALGFGLSPLWRPVAPAAIAVAAVEEEPWTVAVIEPPGYLDGVDMSDESAWDWADPVEESARLDAGDLDAAFEGLSSAEMERLEQLLLAETG